MIDRNPLLADLGRILRFAQQHPLAALLWVGLIGLTIALVVLMRTRWGQAKPVSKCVWLSVFAHILFFGYAYGTRLILGPPSSSSKDDVIEIQMVDAAPTPSRANPDGAKKKSVEPWNRYSPQQSEPIDVVPPVRSDASRQTPVKRQSDDATSQQFTGHQVANIPGTGPTATPSAVPGPQVNTKPEKVASVAPEIESNTAKKTKTTEQDTGPVGPPLKRRPKNETPSTNSFVRNQQEDRPPPVNQLAIDAAKSNVARQAQGSDDPSRGTDYVQRSRVNPLLAGGTDSSQQNPSPMRPVAEHNNGSTTPRRLGDGKPLPRTLANRSPELRARALQKNGGNQQTEAAVRRALSWLAAQQTAGGYWDADALGGGRARRTRDNPNEAGAEADTGVTGLALLAFLGAGHTHMEGEYRQVVDRGLKFLIRIQKADGILAGRANFYARMYCHGMAALALSEAYAMTGDAQLRDSVNRAVGYTLRSQHKESGGWRYHPADREGDMSQFGWQLMVLRSAELAGFEIPASSKTGMNRFLRSVSSGRHGGLASYRRNHRTSAPMTAEALACRCFLQQTDNGAAVREATDYVLQQAPGNGQANYYYWYYGTLAFQQLQGEGWEQWNQAMQREVLKRQRQDGAFAGSWDPDSVWGKHGGRAYCTAMAALCLESYYRYLPLNESLQDGVNGAPRTARRTLKGRERILIPTRPAQR